LAASFDLDNGVDVNFTLVFDPDVTDLALGRFAIKAVGLPGGDPWGGSPRFLKADTTFGEIATPAERSATSELPLFSWHTASTGGGDTFEVHNLYNNGGSLVAAGSKVVCGAAPQTWLTSLPLDPSVLAAGPTRSSFSILDGSGTRLKYDQPTGLLRFNTGEEVLFELIKDSLVYFPDGKRFALKIINPTTHVGDLYARHASSTIYAHTADQRQVAVDNGLALDFSWHFVTAGPAAYKIYTDYNGYHMSYDTAADKLTILPGQYSSAATVFTFDRTLDPFFTSDTAIEP